MKSRTRREERQLSGTMANVQEMVAGPSVLIMARRVGRLLDGQISELDSAMEALERALVGVLERADELRVSTVRNIVGILSPPQTVQFLAAAVQFQLHLRKWGLQRDAQGMASSE